MIVLCKQKDDCVFKVYANKIIENGDFLKIYDDWDRIYVFHKNDIISIEVLI